MTEVVNPSAVLVPQILYGAEVFDSFSRNAAFLLYLSPQGILNGFTRLNASAGKKCDRSAQ
jgi:hypothetical protein